MPDPFWTDEDLRIMVDTDLYPIARFNYAGQRMGWLSVEDLERERANLDAAIACLKGEEAGLRVLNARLQRLRSRFVSYEEWLPRWAEANGEQ